MPMSSPSGDVLLWNASTCPPWNGALLSFSLAEASTPSLPTTRLSGHAEAVTMVAQSGDHVASCSSSGKVLLWNASTSFVSSPADLAGAEAVGYPTCLRVAM
ncbi:hypothetical protein DIPPA_15618 [Diplonema papillatum]|nr:hypothetical protein DIPPA_15618 [Diplonema papillatum]